MNFIDSNKTINTETLRGINTFEQTLNRNRLQDRKDVSSMKKVNQPIASGLPILKRKNLKTNNNILNTPGNIVNNKNTNSYGKYSSSLTKSRIICPNSTSKINRKDKYFDIMLVANNPRRSENNVCQKLWDNGEKIHRPFLIKTPGNQNKNNENNMKSTTERKLKVIKNDMSFFQRRLSIQLTTHENKTTNLSKNLQLDKILGTNNKSLLSDEAKNNTNNHFPSNKHEAPCFLPTNNNTAGDQKVHTSKPKSRDVYSFTENENNLEISPSFDQFNDFNKRDFVLFKQLIKAQEELLENEYKKLSILRKLFHPPDEEC